MYNFSITTIGKQKAGPEQELAERYKKHIKPFAKINHVHLLDSKKGTATQITKKDSEKLHHSLIPNAFHVLLTETGTTYSSKEFSAEIKNWSEHESRTIQFLIAGPRGVEPDLKKSMDASLSLSPMTFPHDIAHLVLLEQLYRTMTILHGKTYHY
jgi:23S rRNA (pseudouridine1915-N3)-methyltransferase